MWMIHFPSTLGGKQRHKKFKKKSNDGVSMAWPFTSCGTSGKRAEPEIFLEQLLDSTTNDNESKRRLRAKEKGACFGVIYLSLCLVSS
jgi:hypothetical protein